MRYVSVYNMGFSCQMNTKHPAHTQDKNRYVTVTQYVTVNPVCRTSSPEMSYLTRNVTITLPECHRQHVTPFQPFFATCHTITTFFCNMSHPPSANLLNQSLNCHSKENYIPHHDSKVSLSLQSSIDKFRILWILCLLYAINLMNREKLRDKTG